MLFNQSVEQLFPLLLLYFESAITRKLQRRVRHFIIRENRFPFSPIPAF